MPLRLFGKAKPQTTPDDSIKRLKETIAILEKREEHLKERVEAEKKIARQHGTKNKRAAFLALKRKKAYESQIETLENTRLNLDQQVLTLEQSILSMLVTESMVDASNSLKRVQRDMKIDDVEKTVEQVQEQVEVAKELSDALARPITGEVYDEDELERELAELEEEDLDQLVSENLPSQKVTTPAPQISLPTAPSAPVEEEDEEFTALQDSMNVEIAY